MKLTLAVGRFVSQKYKYAVYANMQSTLILDSLFHSCVNLYITEPSDESFIVETKVENC